MKKTKPSTDRSDSEGRLETLVIRATELYKYDFYQDEMLVYKITKVTGKRIYVDPKLDWGNITIDKSDIGMKYFLTKEQAMKFEMMKKAAGEWMDLVNGLQWTENIKKRCDKEGINWRAFHI